MPFVNITVIEGRDEATLENCLREVARTVSRTLDTPLETVRVVLQQVPANHWAVGDTLKSES